MFTLYSAATSEVLLTHLVDTLRKQPQPVFAQEQFLVANPGVERWLSQQLAAQFSVFAHYHIALPELFFKQLSRQIDSNLDNLQFATESMLWRIEALLRELTEEVFQPLTRYLTGDSAAVKRYQLASELARLFQRYQQLRPELLSAWQQGQCLTNHPSEAWQQRLWQKITAQIGEQHQGQLWQAASAKLNDATKGQFKYQLPARLWVFGLSALPPLWLQYLNALAKHCEVHFYWLNPLPIDEKNLSGFKNLEGLLHPLLAALGQQGREFGQSLLEQTHATVEILSTTAIPAPRTVLQQLQYDVTHNNQTWQVSKTCQVYAADNSISIHSCHSRMREVEVLKNQLLAALEKNHHLELRDIIVVAPDIQAYAPFIAAVFTDIPHAIAGRSRDAKFCVSTLDALIRFLKLCDSRFGWQAVLDLLEQPAVYPSFDLSEPDLELIKHWLSDTNLRWGKSAAHKQQLDLPPLSENTWQQSLERLLMGYAVGVDQDFVDGVLPYREIEGSAAQALGGLCDFMALLFNASETLTEPKTLQEWSTQLYHSADVLFAQINPGERQQLNEVLADFAEKFTELHQYPIELTVIIHWLEQTVTEQQSASGLLRGSLTFCLMNMVRGLPFQVIAILGMNDGVFPRVDNPATFDLIAQFQQQGDPSLRSEDRQQFLELLLAAQQAVIMTYIGQSLAQNQTIPPSVVISELLEVLEFDYQLKDCVVKHPLQPFSPRYFTGENKAWFSYSKADCETALALTAIKPDIKVWWQGRIAAESAESIELAEMFAFYRHPQRYFLRRQLELRFQGLTADAPEREPFEIDYLDNYVIQHDWINALLLGEDFTVAKLQAQGCWLSGVMGELEFARQQQQISEFVAQITALSLGEKLADQAVDLNFSTYRLIGKLSNRYQQGSLFYRFANLKAKDLLIALLQHCVMNQLEPHSTYLLSLDELLILTPELASPALLEALINFFIQGQHQPDVLFTESVLDYVKQAYALKNSNRATKPALEVAQEKLQLTLEKDYEPELRRLYADGEGLAALLGEEFVNFCEQMLLPVWEATHEI
jgi:exodeoxyribonuclease V gamma subunit